MRVDQRLLLNSKLRDAGFTVIQSAKFLYVVAKLRLKIAVGFLEKGETSPAFKNLEQSFFTGIEALVLEQHLPLSSPGLSEKLKELVEETRSLLM